MDTLSPPRFRAGILTLSILFSLYLLPLPAFSVSYVASKNSDTFHESSCFYVDRILEKNKVYFSTLEEAKRSGRYGCSRCKPGSGKTSSSTSSSISTTSSDSYSIGYSSGKAQGEKDGYNIGYAAGKADGEKDGYKSGYSAGQSDMESVMTVQMEKSVRKAKSDSYLISAIVGVPLVFFLSSFLSRKRKTASDQRLENQLQSLKRELRMYRFLNGINVGNAEITPIPTIPDDVVIGAVFFPIKGKKTPDHPYGDYTVYTSRSGKKYHCRCGCCGADSPAHVFDVVPEYTPCSNCVPDYRRITEAPDWYCQIKRTDI